MVGRKAAVRARSFSSAALPRGPFVVSAETAMHFCGAFFRCTIFPDCIIQNRIEGKVEELSSKNAQLAADAGIAAPSAPSVTVVPDFAILKNMLVR